MFFTHLQGAVLHWPNSNFIVVFYLGLLYRKIQHGQPSWIITLEDPAAVLQFFRTTLDGSLCNVAHLLLHNGILFNTFSPPPHMSNSNALHGKVGYAYVVRMLTQCPFQHKPDTMDYSQYKEICDQLLSCPDKWAALLEGGIVW